MATSTRRKDMTGVRYGRLVAKQLSKVENERTYWEFVCDCGKCVILERWNVVCGRTKSCGCFLQDWITENRTVHGMTTSKECIAYHNMIRRCRDTTGVNYERYGSRGIKVCARWLDSFENFYADMGAAPTKEHTVDRTDNDGDYEPSNCRWATRTEQVLNRSNTISNDTIVSILSCRGKPLKELAAAHRISVNSVCRILSGKRKTI